MKKSIITLVVILFTAASVFSQKYAYVDTEYILTNIPEYTDAQDMLDELASEWQKEIEERFAEIDQLYKSYQAEAILLPADMKKQKENEIVEKEKEAKDLQKQRFGPNGDLHKKRMELVQPIQEKVFTAIEEIANTRNFAFVFDRASGATILFAQSKFDISDDVLDEIGMVMQTVKKDSRKKSSYQSSQSKSPSTPPPPGGKRN